MKSTFLHATLAFGLAAIPASGQSTRPAVEDFKPASTNQVGKDYPQVNSEGRVRARIAAPQAREVFLVVNGIKFPMIKDANGVWTGDSTPFDEGNHYYNLLVDSASVPDPGSTYIFGSGMWQNDIEIPAKDQDFYSLKNVPHGQVREVLYFGKTSNAMRHAFIYTPPDYDKDPAKRYPVLYLQHGYREGESGWSGQGHAGLIIDNLLAEGKCKPFIIVMENGGISNGRGGRPNLPPGSPANGAPHGEPIAIERLPAAQAATVPATATAPATASAPATAPTPFAGRGGRGGMGPMGGMGGDFEQILLKDVIPYVDANFRTIADQPHRALAGLSMGGMQTRQIGLAHLDTFAYVGVFSGGSIAPADVKDMDAFKQKVKLVFVSYGSREVDPAARRARPGGGGGGALGGDPKANTDALQAAGVNTRYYVSPQTAHEWQSWRRSLHEFAPLVFKD